MSVVVSKIFNKTNILFYSNGYSIAASCTTEYNQATPQITQAIPHNILWLIDCGSLSALKA